MQRFSNDINDTARTPALATLAEALPDPGHCPAACRIAIVLHLGDKPADSPVWPGT